MSDQQLEQMIQDKGLTAPRVTPSDLDKVIRHAFYFTAHEGTQGAELEARRVQAGMPLKVNPITTEERRVNEKNPLTLLTFCVLVLENGFTVTGESACASPENFNKEVGQKVAYDNAKSKLWSLLGYELKTQLHKEQQNRELLADLDEDGCGGACKI